MQNTNENKKTSKDVKGIVLKWLFFVTLAAAIVGYTTLAIQIFVFDYDVCGWFPDFAEVLSYCKVGNPYDGSSGITAIYPPISFLIFLPFLIFCHNEIGDLLAGKCNLLTISTRPMFNFAFLIYFLITAVLSLLIIAKMTKLKGKNLFYLIGTIVLSGPFYFIFNRGNIVFATFLFILIFFWLYQSEKRWQRELALVSLALAIAMKIYPVFVVLVLFKDRRWLDILKTGVYATLFVFVPFVFIEGNMIDNIKCIFDSYDRLVNIGGAFIGASTSFDGMGIEIAYLFEKGLGVDISYGMHILTTILKFALVIVSVVTLFVCYKSERKLEVASIAIGCYLLFQSVSYAYVFVFTFILFALFLNTMENYRKADVIMYSLLFGIIFFSVPFFFRNCTVQFFALVVLVVKAIVKLWSDFAITVKNKKNAVRSATTEY